MTSSSVATSSVRVRSSGRLAELIRQLQQDPADFFGFLLFELDDLVVDLNRLHRLDEQARAAGRSAVDDAGNRAAMFGAHHQDVAAVAIRDDLLLQILRRLPSAQKRVERGAQARFLLTQPLADGGERGTGVVGNLSGRVDLPAHVGNLALE